MKKPKKNRLIMVNLNYITNISGLEKQKLSKLLFAFLKNLFLRQGENNLLHKFEQNFNH